jgi:hypothetical protein
MQKGVSLAELHHLNTQFAPSERACRAAGEGIDELRSLPNGPWLVLTGSAFRYRLACQMRDCTLFASSCYEILISILL